MSKRPLEVVLALVLLIGLPLVGLWLADLPVSRYLEFPPRTNDLEHAPFSWPVFLLVGGAIIGSIAPILLRVLLSNLHPAVAGGRYRGSPAQHAARSTEHGCRFMPWWGWAGLGWTGLWWVLAWTRFPWMAPLQADTFTPLWLGYIAIVNATTFARSGSCMLLDRPRHLLALFPASAAFWWFFEYLNRFVQNWHYPGVDDVSALEYILRATIPFSTVLPSVMGTAELLTTFPEVSAGLDRCTPVRLRHPRPAAWTTLLLSGAGLMGIGLWPDVLFPLVWVGPLLLILSLQVLAGRATILSPLAHGDWRPIWLPALAALVCGFFWELWNWRSLAHWTYSLPFVQDFHVFEMPLLGYSGYLPFGLECVVVAEFILRRTTSRD